MKKNLIKSGTGKCMFAFMDCTNSTAEEIIKITKMAGKASSYKCNLCRELDNF